MFFHAKSNFLGNFNGTHGQFGSTNFSGEDSTIAKNVQSIGKTLMMNGDERDVEGDFMPNDGNLTFVQEKIMLSLFEHVT